MSGLLSSRRRWVVLSAALAVGVLSALHAAAAPNDAEADRLDREAMDRHFAAADFKKAKKSLDRALKSCKSGCSAKVRARLHRDLGVVLVTGFSDPDAGAREFSRAIEADPKVALQPEYATDEVREIFGRVSAGSKREAPAAGEAIRHEPVAEQRVNTPVPIYAELTTEAEEVTGRVHYRGGDDKSWHGVRMKRVGDGFGAQIPCEALKKTGKLSYYIRFKDADGASVGDAGSRDQPYELQITSEGPEEPPHLPGKRPPKRCSEDTEGSEGEATEEPPATSRAPAGPPAVWLGFGLAQDAPLFAGDDVCSMQSQLERGFACFRSTGTQYHGTPVQGTAGTINPTFTLATTRIYLASNIRLSRAIDLGLRVGYAIAGQGLQPDGGKAFFPMHAEVRGQYWLSGEAFPAEFGTFVFAGGGVAQIDAKGSVTVTEDTSVPKPPGQIDNPETQSLDAYKKMGLSFVAAGAGAYLPFGSTHGVVADLKAMALFPDSGIAFELELGYAFGL